MHNTKGIRFGILCQVSVTKYKSLHLNRHMHEQYTERSLSVNDSICKDNVEVGDAMQDVEQYTDYIRFCDNS
jgi:hypothetical protein